MNLHAGSLYRNFLVLYGEKDDLGRRIIQVDNQRLQWDIYCNEVKFDAVDSKLASVTFKDKVYEFPYFISKDPMKDLGFSS